MKNFLQITLIVFLTGISIQASAALYSWVDKNGKKHYGDQIPPEYANQAKTVEVNKGNTMQAPPEVKFYEAPANTQNYPQYNRNDNQSTNRNSNSCEAQKRAYEESQACYNNCRLQNGYVNNVAACSRCKDVKRPSCN